MGIEINDPEEFAKIYKKDLMLAIGVLHKNINRIDEKLDRIPDQCRVEYDDRYVSKNWLKVKVAWFSGAWCILSALGFTVISRLLNK